LRFSPVFPFRAEFAFVAPPGNIAIMRRFSSIRLSAVSALLALGFAGIVGVGCSLAPSGGMADRCADLMQRTYPGATFDIVKSEAAATSITTIVARVEAQRRDLPPDAPLRRDVAVECRFDNGVLTGFRWTKGPTR
jgi:hypothetical protein